MVAKLRHTAGWTLKQLAERSGINLTVIHDIEVGRTKEAKRPTLEKLAAAFGLTLIDLLSLIPPQPIRLDVPISVRQRRRTKLVGRRFRGARSA